MEMPEGWIDLYANTAGRTMKDDRLEISCVELFRICELMKQMAEALERVAYRYPQTYDDYPDLLNTIKKFKEWK